MENQVDVSEDWSQIGQQYGMNVFTQAVMGEAETDKAILLKMKINEKVLDCTQLSTFI